MHGHLKSILINLFLTLIKIELWLRCYRAKIIVNKYVASRASHRRHQYAILASSPGSFDRRLNFRILVSSSLVLVQNVSKTSAFVTGKCPLKVKSAGVISKNGVKMAYFRTCALEKWGQLAFTRVGLLVNLYSVLTTLMVPGNGGTIYF